MMHWKRITLELSMRKLELSIAILKKWTANFIEMDITFLLIIIHDTKHGVLFNVCVCVYAYNNILSKDTGMLL